MSLNWPTYGLGNVASYQASTQPFLTSSLHVTGSSPLEIKFPAVTKFVTVTNTLPGGANALTYNYFHVQGYIEDTT